MKHWEELKDVSLLSRQLILTLVNNFFILYKLLKENLPSLGVDQRIKSKRWI